MTQALEIGDCVRVQIVEPPTGKAGRWVNAVMQKDKHFKKRWNKGRVRRTTALEKFWVPAAGEGATVVVDRTILGCLRSLQERGHKVRIEKETTVLVARGDWLPEPQASIAGDGDPQAAVASA